jgi:porin
LLRGKGIDAPCPFAHHGAVSDVANPCPRCRAAWRPQCAAEIALVIVALLAMPPAHAEPTGRPLGDHLLYSSRLIGEAGGARTRLERLGIDFKLFYNQVLSGKPAGGGANPDGVFGHSGSYDFFTRVDLDALVGWTGADVLLHVRGQYDRNLNAAVGALSDPIDDADFDRPIYVDQLWIQQSVLGGRLRLLLGLSEQQRVFDRNAYANTEDRQFLTSYLDNNGVVPLPNGLAVTVIVSPVSWLELALGVADADNLPRHGGFDTAFDGIDSLTGYFEVKLRSPWAERDLPGSYRLGIFVDGRTRVDFRTGRPRSGHVGAYASFDQLVWRERAGEQEGAGVFARVGYADPDVNRESWFWSLGFQYAGALPSRNRDVLGLGVYQTIGSAAYRKWIDPRFDHETGIEIYYAMRTLGWLVITPDFQYIIDPGATGTIGNAFVASLRLRVTF